MRSANAVREHWGIESMHWVLDVSIDEDACQIYKNNGATNLSCLRYLGLNMLRYMPNLLTSLFNQRKRPVASPCRSE